MIDWVGLGVRDEAFLEKTKRGRINTPFYNRPLYLVGPFEPPSTVDPCILRSVISGKFVVCLQKNIYCMKPCKFVRIQAHCV
jgi:hypothetical protein